LIEVASSHPDVVQDPAPVALFRGFGESSLDFELRFWSPHPNSYQQLKSQVAVGIIVAFRDAGIQIPFPQRELHIKGLDSSITKAVAAERQWPDSAR
jgi:small-conductance mechanosensitive channel